MPSHDPAKTSDGWRAMLRDERRRLGLTQRALATAAHISPDAIRKYENGTRTPSREALFRILEAVQVPQERARMIVSEAGFAPIDRLFPLTANPGYFFTRDELPAYVETVPWPRFVANNVMEIVAANQAARRVWAVDFDAEYARRNRQQLHFLTLLAEPRFASRIENFDECLATAVSVLKAVPRGGAALDHPGPWVRAVLAQFATADPDAVARLLRAWESTPPAAAKVHLRYRVVWREPGYDAIRFVGIVSDASEPDGFAFNDWMPEDAASHATLEALLGARAGVVSEPTTARTSRGRRADRARPQGSTR